MSIYSEHLQEIDEEQYISEEEEDDEEEDLTDTCSSPSIPDENINFDLVYALHTFTATVEGQASVVKGDALVLMEDTNIYWWLVEVFNTRDVGYIPAENIETPYERLARLNKHRNLEITSPSLYDVTPSSIIHPFDTNTRHVTIEEDYKVFHYEADLEEDDEESIEDCESIKEKVQEYTEMKIEPEIQEAENIQEIRVFAGNIAPESHFHTFVISYSTTTDELIKKAADQFGVQEEKEEDSTVEYYIAVQGLDGDEYILSAQDKPLSIFKTLTDSLTTPMPSLSNYRRISQQPITDKRARSSSFSKYEQTNHEEDSVIRFYIHRRIKFKQQSLVYIKVALYPDRLKNKKRGLEMDRMDKVIAVNQELSIEKVIQLALEKFHVPKENLAKQLKKYQLSVKSHNDSFMDNNTIQMAKPNSNTTYMSSEKRKDSLKQHFKRLVGWGSASANSKKQQQQKQLTDSSQSDTLFVKPEEQTKTEPIYINSPLSEEPQEDSTISEESIKELPQESVYQESHDEGAQETKVIEKEKDKEQEEERKEDEVMGEAVEARMSTTSKNSIVSRDISHHSINAIHQAIHNTNNTTITTTQHKLPSNQNKDLDDLYMLVAHGVDFLKTREDTKWEEEGGYEFHPWNRPQSSFAVRPKDRKKINPTQKDPLSPPMTPISQSVEPAPEQTEEEKKERELSLSLAAKRILSGKLSSDDEEVEDEEGTEQKPVSVDDEELQRIVAAHIVF